MFCSEDNDENREFKKEFKKFGFLLRKPNELTEDSWLETPLEKALYKEEFKSFELIYKACCLMENKEFVYIVFMRNLDIIKMLKELIQVTG